MKNNVVEHLNVALGLGMDNPEQLAASKRKLEQKNLKRQEEYQNQRKLTKTVVGKVRAADKAEKPVAQIDSTMGLAKDAIAEAWAEYEPTEKRGLAFGEVCFHWQQKLGAKGKKMKGFGLLPLLKSLEIPRATAYFWIDRYKVSEGLIEAKEKKPSKTVAPVTQQVSKICSILDIPAPEIGSTKLEPVTWKISESETEEQMKLRHADELRTAKDAVFAAENVLLYARKEERATVIRHKKEVEALVKRITQSFSQTQTKRNRHAAA